MSGATSTKKPKGPELNEVTDKAERPYNAGIDQRKADRAKQRLQAELYGQQPQESSKKPKRKKSNCTMS
jgi:hypothetical protein